MRKFILTVYHFLPTIICIVIVTIIAVHFQIETIGAVLLGAFFTLVQPFIDKMREIGRRLEAERQARESAAPPRLEETRPLARSFPETSRRVKESLGASRPPQPQIKETEPEAERVPLDLAGIFAPVTKPVIILAGILLILAVGWCAYLYFFLYP